VTRNDDDDDDNSNNNNNNVKWYKEHPAVSLK
jgi:hypothetical protein